MDNYTESESRQLSMAMSRPRVSFSFVPLTWPALQITMLEPAVNNRLQSIREQTLPHALPKEPEEKQAGGPDPLPAIGRVPV